MSIRIKSLTKTFEDQVLFKNLTFDIPLQKTTVLTGCSGCGKTTLLRIIAGLDKDFEGRIIDVPERISFMFQEDRLLPWYSVKNNIEFVLKDIMDKAERDALVNSMIASFQLAGHENKLPSKLSGGMKRRVAMARAFCYPSDLLLMDEPFKGFDSKLKLDMITLFNQLYHQTNKTVILVTHDEAVIDKLNGEILNLDIQVHH